jgi:hypothetical protein
LNNEKDKISLSNRNNEIIDAISYEKAEREKSYNRINSSWKWSDHPTPGEENVTDLPIITKKENQINSEFKEKDGGSPDAELNVASILRNESPKSNKQIACLIALLLATISGLMALFIKKSLN